jgi:hypothetical protein
MKKGQAAPLANLPVEVREEATNCGSSCPSLP